MIFSSHHELIIQKREGFFLKIGSTHNRGNVDDRRVLQAQLDDFTHHDLTHIDHGFVIHRENPETIKDLKII